MQVCSYYYAAASLACNKSISQSIDRLNRPMCCSIHPPHLRSLPTATITHTHMQHSSSLVARERLDQLHDPCRELPGLPGPGQGRGLRVVPGGGRLRLGFRLHRPGQYMSRQLHLGHLHLAGAERAHLRLLPKLYDAPVRS